MKRLIGIINTVFTINIIFYSHNHDIINIVHFHLKDNHRGEIISIIFKRILYTIYLITPFSFYWELRRFLILLITGIIYI